MSRISFSLVHFRGDTEMDGGIN